jgi:hypothetical protein
MRAWITSAPTRAGPVVFESVVVSAEEYQVPEGGRPAVGPMPLVMSVTPSGWSIAARGVLTMTVTDVEGPPHGGGDGPGGPADVDQFGAGSEDNAADGAITCIPTDLLRREDVPVH